jgi:hypothetical protein
MTDDRTLRVPADRVETVARVLRRSIANDAAEVRRLTILGTAYFDRPAGSNVDAQLEQAKRQRDAAQELLDQLEPEGTTPSPDAGAGS